jgi:phosphohistidine phosphatase
MRQLVLFRHAKAVPADDAPDDFDRALANRGREDAPRVARALRDAGAAPDVVLVSEARRTRETWDLAAPSFPGAEVRFLRKLYLAPAETLLTEAQRAGAERVMIVAHNPGVHELACRLAPRNNKQESRLRAGVPTAGAAIFERKDEDSSWKLAIFLTPKDGAG